MRYLEGLAAPDTVTTVPSLTLDAFRNHGTVPASLESADNDNATLAGAAACGLDLSAITEQLQADRLAVFAQSYEQLLKELAHQRRTLARTVS